LGASLKVQTSLESVAKKQPLRAAPVQAKERIEFVDILRGFALLGVLLVNMYGFSGQGTVYHDPQAASGIDRAVVVLIRFLVEAKFYSMFCFLFGWGMAMQVIRAGAKGTRFRPVFLRRLSILLIIGVLHAALIWDGDILTTYALFGFLLLLFRKRSGKALLVTAVLVLLLSIVLTVPGEAMDAFRGWYENLTDFLRLDTDPDSLYATGAYKEITRLRIQEFMAGHSRFIYNFGNIFGMFLLGLYVGKRRIFQDIDQHLPLLRRVVWVGLGIGLIFNAIFASAILWPGRVPSEYHQLVRVGARTIGAPALMLFYVSGIILLVQKENWHRRLSPLANVGRSALSNYLLQSVVCTLIFYNYGLGLYGEIGPTFGLMLTVAIYWAQVRLSGWWFERFQFGPMEWVWRTLTYLRRQPLRREATHDDRLSAAWRKVRPIAARVDPKIALVSVWVVLLLWAGSLVTWHFRLKETSNTQYPISNIQQTSPSVAQATATPILAQEDDQPEGQPHVVTTPVVQPVAYNPGPIAASGDPLALAFTFSAESALAQIEALTGPPHLGRYTGSPEGWAAGDYIAEQFARCGLQPAGDDGTFFQSFPVFYTALAQVPILVIEGPDGAVYDHYSLNEDFSTILRWYSGAGTANGEVIWANDCTHDDFDPVEVVDKIVLCRGSSVPLVDAERNALEHGAAGLLLLTDPEQRPPDFGNTHCETWVPEPIPVFRVYPSVADDLLLGSGKSVEDLSISFKSFTLSTQVRMEVTTTGPEACPNEGCQGRNVLGVIPGRDPEYADQVIIIGGHYDHLGQTPDGTIWPGANDDASGVAVLLEMACSWHEQGYVPRHTVLFAAWDAEEVGLLGSRYYVEHPRYPLENTVAKIQLDMVGAGGDRLLIDGGGDLGERLRSVAEALSIEAESTNGGGSDHAPFLRAGVQASLLIWYYGDGSEPQWHRPGDTPDVIELDKLDAVGKIVGITTLGITEAEPDMGDLLARRAAAVEQGDLEAFLATSLPDQEAGDRSWFADAQTFLASRFEMLASDVRVLGRTATATVRMTLKCPVEGEEEPKVVTASLDARFVHGENGWRWAGPDLVWADQEAGFAVAYPPGKEDLDGLGQEAAGKYAEIAELLGLPMEPDAALLLFSRFESLRVSTALSLSPGRGMWVAPGVVKLVYSEGIGDSPQLDDALAQLLLAEAGVPEAAAPWLWQGLPLVLRAVERRSPDRALVETHTEYLPRLRKALDEETVALNEATAWAAVDHLRQRIGWEGLGQFIIALGQACRAGLCDSADGMNLALSDAIQMDSSTFEPAWQAHWRDGLATAQSNVDAVLAARTEAVLAGDEAAFLNTVDPDVPNLMAEEQHWLAGSTSLTSFSLIGEPLALLEDGSILAHVTLEYRLAGSASNLQLPTSNFQVLFTPSGEGYRWAGVPFEILRSDRGSVLYPEGQEGLAWALLNEAETIYAQLATDLGVEQPDPLTIKLYDSDDVFRTSIFLSFPQVNWVLAWTGEGESVKLRWQQNAALADYRPTLALQLARRLLYQLGLDAEWLVKGVSIYLSRNFDGGVTERATAENLYPLLRAVPKGTLRGLGAMPPDYELSSDELGLVNAQAWDAVRYLVYTYGGDTVIELLHSQDASLQDTIGQTLLEFEAAWSESVVQAHTFPEWIEIAWDFDPDRAYEHVEYLIRPELAGRRAGSRGAEAAAAYIADKFAEYGLMPVGEGDAFLQHFPISYTTLLSTPRLEIMDENGHTLEALTYREDFLILASEAGSGGTATGELIWIQDSDYEGMELDGKIVLRTSIDSIDNAVEHGAGGLILMGRKESEKELLAKTPLEAPSDGAIPVLELTSVGSLKLLEMVGHTRESILDSPPALPLGLKARMEIPFSTPETVETANVLGLLPGSDPVLGQEVIILGAHYDHVGDDPDRRYAGANDNASGVGVLLEMARLWQEAGYRPQRSVLFAAWGAQEPGELGSSYYVDNPVLLLDKTVAMLQLDAVGGGSGYYLEARGEWEQDGVLLFSMMATEDLADGRLALRGQARESDQVPFHEVGLPTLLITWRGASEDNWPVEIADEVDPYRLGVTGRMVTLALMSIAR